MTYNNSPNQLANLKKGKRFGEGQPRSQDLPDANRPWSIRKSLKELAAQKIRPGDKEAIRKLLPALPTLAQVIAANTLRAATAGDMRAVEYVTDCIDGKLPQITQNPDGDFREVPVSLNVTFVAAGPTSQPASAGAITVDAPSRGRGRPSREMALSALGPEVSFVSAKPS